MRHEAEDDPPAGPTDTWVDKTAADNAWTEESVLKLVARVRSGRGRAVFLDFSFPA